MIYISQKLLPSVERTSITVPKEQSNSTTQTSLPIRNLGMSAIVVFSLTIGSPYRYRTDTDRKARQEANVQRVLLLVVVSPDPHIVPGEAERYGHVHTCTLDLEPRHQFHTPSCHYPYLAISSETTDSILYNSFHHRSGR